MGKFILLLIFVSTNIISIANATPSCYDPCQTLSDGYGQLITFSSTTENGQLICINGKCNDNPGIGTGDICREGSSPSPPDGTSSCNGPCQTLNDCDGQLICINGKCNDDPDIGTHICGGGSSPSSTGGGCQELGRVTCDGNSYPTYNCSPQVTSSTSATLKLIDFQFDGGATPSGCEGTYHSNDERIVELSTGWYDGGSRCGKTIHIKANNGRNVTAKVVDECDSMYACPPCVNNRVDGSKAVWKALGLDSDIDEVSATWSMA